MPDTFPHNRYDTPENTPRWWVDKLAFGSRWSFFAGFLGLVLRYWWPARQGRYGRQMWAASCRDVLRLVEACGGRVHITGLDNLRRGTGPYVFVSNHMSSLETAVMPALIAPLMPVTFVAKSSVVKYPFFGRLISATDPIVVHRENPRQDFEAVMKAGQAHLAAGTSVVVYPQSTRTAVFDPKAFNTLGVKLAKRARVPLLPVAVKTDFWDNGDYLKDFGPIHRQRPIHLAFGTPIPVANGKEAHQQVIDFIQAHLQQWQVADGG